LLRRWRQQGFEFSPDEPSALLQSFGGPCGVLAAVQAYFLKNLLFVQRQENWRKPESRECLLVQALCDILCRAAPRAESPYVLVMNPGLHNRDLSFTDFHNQLLLRSVASRDELEAFLLSVIEQYQTEYGVLCFLYSVMLTRGLDQIAADMACDAQPMIALPFGHAN
jgi:hypothetical protein